MKRTLAIHTMPARVRLRLGGIAVAAGLLTGVAGCVAGGHAIEPLIADRQVVIEGRVASVDKSPMAYDGDALVVVSTDAHGAVTVHLPARRNLCKAQGFDLLETLKTGDKLQVEGMATGPRDVTVCLDASQRLQRID